MPVSLFDSFDTSLNSCRYEQTVCVSHSLTTQVRKGLTLNSLVPADMQSLQIVTKWSSGRKQSRRMSQTAIVVSEPTVCASFLRNALQLQ